MRIKKYKQFLTEAADSLDDATFDGMKEDVEKMIKDTIGEDGDIKDFVKKYVEAPERVEIEGLINDDQVHDFWLKYENEIDELLNKVKFFDESPNELNAIGTYKYIIVSTKRAVLEVVRMLSE
jgi:hypothetical protein